MLCWTLTVTRTRENRGEAAEKLERLESTSDFTLRMKGLSHSSPWHAVKVSIFKCIKSTGLVVS